VLYLAAALAATATAAGGLALALLRSRRAHAADVAVLRQRLRSALSRLEQVERHAAAPPQPMEQPPFDRGEAPVGAPPRGSRTLH
jgi:hypothetical protein